MDTTTAERRIRAIGPADRAAWEPLWRAHLADQDTALPDAAFDTTFARLTSGAPGEFRGLIAFRGGEPAGIAHFLAHRTCWSLADRVRLQDLYVAPGARGAGLGQALIAAVHAAADAAGTPGARWLTAETNPRARALHDRIGRRTPFIRHRRAA